VLQISVQKLSAKQWALQLRGSLKFVGELSTIQNCDPLINAVNGTQHTQLIASSALP
jgi:hypothetical protein